jgi:ABC-type phosphate transport system permease subunit
VIKGGNIPCFSHKALETQRTQGLHRKTTTKKKTTDIIARVAQEIIIIIIIIIIFFFFVSSVLFLKETSMRTFLSQSTTRCCWI